MKPWAGRVGIRTRLLVLVLSLCVPFLAYVTLSAARQAEEARESARQRILAAAQLTAARLDDHLGNMRQMLATLSHITGRRLEDTGRNDALLQRLKPNLPAHVNNVTVWTRAGENIGSLDPTLRQRPVSVLDRAYFQDALRTGTLAVEAPIISRSNAEPIVVFAFPMFEDGEVVGLVAASTRLKALQELLDAKGTLPAAAVVTVLDVQGTVLTRSQEPERWIGQTVPAGSVSLDRQLTQRAGTEETVSLDGQVRVFGFAATQALPWLVYVGFPADTVLAPVRAHLYGNLALGGAMLLAGLVLAAWLTERISRPLHQLGQDAAAFARGDLAHRSRVDAVGEVGVLGGTLNRMAEALQERGAAMARSEERLSLALEGSGLALFDWDIGRDRIYYSAQAAVFRGESAGDTVVTPAQMRTYVHPDDLDEVLRRLAAAVKGSEPRYHAEYRVRHAEGGWVWLRSRGRVVERDASGRALRLAGTDAEITQRKQKELRLRQLAELDSLTGLPNRALFLARLQQGLGRAARRQQPVTLMFLDIDHFKRINDTLGHEAGDRLLTVFAQRMAEALGPSDTVARLAGDEFTVLAEAVADPAQAHTLAMALVQAARAPIDLGGQRVRITTSIGIAMSRPGETDGAALLRRADAALYEAKRHGRDRCWHDSGAPEAVARALAVDAQR